MGLGPMGISFWQNLPYDSPSAGAKLLRFPGGSEYASAGAKLLRFPGGGALVLERFVGVPNRKGHLVSIESKGL